MTALIIFTIVYGLVLLCYLYTRTTGNMKLRAPNKIILSTMFLVWGIVQFELNYSLNSVVTFLVVGLFLAYLGDIFLLFDFGRGGDFFLCSNVVFFTFEIIVLNNKGILFANYFWIFIVFALIIITFIILCKKFPNIIKLGKFRWPFIMYISSITLHGLAGLALMIYVPEMKYLLLGLGSMLFMVSDYFLTVNKFIIPNKWIVRANSITYFSGMFLMAISIGL